MKRRIAALLAFVLVLSTCMTAMAASYSVNWKQAADGNWQAFNNGVLLKNTWILDDQCDVAGGIYYLVDENGNLVTSQLIKDGEGRYYTFNDQHDGHFGAMRTANGKYQGVNLTFSAVHDGSFGSITNADGIKALAAKVGVKEMPDIKNASTVKMSEVSKVTSTSGTSGGSQEYTVYQKLSFDVNLATADPAVIDAQMIKTGGKGVKPASPIDANGKMTFTGWTVTKDGTDYWDFANGTVNKNIILYGKWVDTTYTVSFDVNNANAVPASYSSQAVVVDKKAVKPASPSDATGKKEFLGWTETKDGDDYWIFEEDIVIEDMTLYARWDGRQFYAVYNTEAEGAGRPANTLSFYYDDNIDTHKGVSGKTVYEDLPTEAKSAGDWGYDGIRADVKKIIIAESVKAYKKLTSTAGMFSKFTKIDSIVGCENLDVSNVTNMSSMFYQFANDSTIITEVPDVSEWDTSKVTNMSQMFALYGYYSTGLAAVPDVSEWDTGKVTDMKQLFYNYAYKSTGITSVPDVSNWDTGKVTNMVQLFSSYAGSSTGITSVPDVSEWDTGSVTNMSTMFSSYARSSTGITSVPDVSNWNTGKVTDMRSMFSGYANSSTSINSVPNVKNWDTGNATNLMGMFQSYAVNSTSLSAVPDVSGWNTSKVTTMLSMFKGYGSGSTTTLDALDLSGWSIDSLTSAGEMFSYYAYKNTQGAPVVYATNWNVTKATGVGALQMFRNSKLRNSTNTSDDQWNKADTSSTGCFTSKAPH